MTNQIFVEMFYLNSDGSDGKKRCVVFLTWSDFGQFLFLVFTQNDFDPVQKCVLLK